MLQDVLRLYAFSLFLQLLLLIPYLLKAHHFRQTSKQAIHKTLDMLVHAAPPAIPAVMLLCGFAITVRLRKLDITLMFPEVLKLSADTEVVCFDKTGTLTGSLVSPSFHLPFVACWVWGRRRASGEGGGEGTEEMCVCVCVEERGCASGVG